MARKGNPISVRLGLNRSSDSSRLSGGGRGRIKLLFQLSARRACIPFLVPISLLIFFYLLCLQMGAHSFFFDFVSRVAGFLGVKAVSVLFLKMGCPAALAFVIGCACRALVTPEANASLGHWVLPGPSHQPHVAEEVPHQEGLRDHPVATRSAPPVDLEVKQPLMGDQQRHEELANRLNHHFLGKSEQIGSLAYDDLLDKQILIEEKLEIALLNEGFSRDRILANRYEIRELIFYKEGVPLKEETLGMHLAQIQSDPFSNIPYRKIQRSIRNLDLFFSK
uniref:Uncharacterized protein n=1 Tax=Lactuca saligna TaxID=75948 RepID=A0A8F5ANG8_LACSI|nr:hypothetical protein [Lactuca saligna]